MDLGTVLGDTHRNRLSLQVEGTRRPVPAWADWLIWLGLWMRFQAAMDGRRVAVVRLPTRRLAAAFVSFGALLAASRVHDDSLDWEALQALPKGTTVHWREAKGGKSTSYTGTVDVVRDMVGSKCLVISVESPKRYSGTTFFLPRATALTYGVTLGVVTTRTDKQLTAATSLLSSVTDNPSHSWIRSAAADSTLVTEGASFFADLSDLALVTGQTGAVPFAEALAIASTSNRQHGKLQMIASRADFFHDTPEGLTVLDGPAAAMRLGSAQARSIVLLLDHSEYDEEFVHVISPFVGSSIDAGIHVPPDGVLVPPDCVEIFVFGVPGNAGVGA
jgi:hypothetical protein